MDSLRQMLMLLVGEALRPQCSTRGQYLLPDGHRAGARGAAVGDAPASRGQGSTILVRGEMSNTERVQILGRMNVLLTQSSDLRHKFGALERSGTPIPAGWKDALTHDGRVRQPVRSVFGADALEADRLLRAASQTLGELAARRP